jgi:hypothetical protein
MGMTERHTPVDCGRNEEITWEMQIPQIKIYKMVQKNWKVCVGRIPEYILK